MGNTHNAHVTVGNITGAIGVAVGNRARSSVRIEHYHERWRPPPPREVPGLPTYYYARPEVLQPIRDLLSLSTQAVVALTGLEGVGKTTLSCELAHQLQGRFTHGVLWGDCRGRPGELNDLLGGFLAKLGADRDQVPSYDERVTSLRTILANRHVLIVFDNLQDTQFDPRSLLSVHGNSCILITTPNRALAAELADEVVDVPPLSDDAAHQLLQQMTGDTLGLLSAELFDRLLEQSGRMPGLLVDLGRQARRLRRQGPYVLEEWARSVTLDWHDQESLYEFTFHQLDSRARQAFELVGMLANTSFDSALIAAGLRIESSPTQRLLVQLESFSLLDREVDGRFVARTAAYRFAQKQLAASGNVERYLHPTVDYIVDLLDHLTLLDNLDSSVILHAQEIFHRCLAIQAWPLLHRFTAITLRQTTVRGSVSFWYRSDGFLSQFIEVNFSHATVCDSSLALAKFVGCNFATGTLATVNLPGAQFVECNFADMRLLQVDLRRAQFAGCNFADSHFLKTDMRGAQFVECNFANCIFADVRMQDTTFISCSGISAIKEAAGGEASGQ